jgi:hypothetical protein
MIVRVLRSSFDILCNSGSASVAVLKIPPLRGSSESLRRAPTTRRVSLFVVMFKHHNQYRSRRVYDDMFEVGQVAPPGSKNPDCTDNACGKTNHPSFVGSIRMQGERDEERGVTQLNGYTTKILCIYTVMQVQRMLLFVTWCDPSEA